MKQQIKQFAHDHKKVLVTLGVVSYIGLLVGACYLLFHILNTGINEFTTYFEIYDSRFNLLYWALTGLGLFLPLVHVSMQKKTWYRNSITLKTAIGASVFTSVVCYTGWVIRWFEINSLVVVGLFMLFTALITVWTTKKAWRTL